MALSDTWPVPSVGQGRASGTWPVSAFAQCPRAVELTEESGALAMAVSRPNAVGTPAAACPGTKLCLEGTRVAPPMRERHEGRSGHQGSDAHFKPSTNTTEIRFTI